MTESNPSSASDAIHDGGATRLVLAWLVHLLTASGAVFGTFALLLIFDGNFRGAALLMLLTLTIDAVDGTLARAVGVSRVLPKIDGRRLDDMIDYFNFVIVPCVFLVRADLLLSQWWIALPILASAYGFSRVDAKTEDDFFLGFPSYWNFIALYCWLLGLSPLAGTLWLAGLSIAVFVPIKCVYPSKMPVLRTPTLVGGIAWAALFSLAIYEPALAETYLLVEISLVYMVYYWVLSFWLGGIQRADRPRD
jgi:phosphatidylcholine synthase